MSETIPLSKELIIPTNGRMHFENLEEVVRDLSSIPFSRKEKSYYNGAFVGPHYNIKYGTNNVRDNSGVLKEKNVRKHCIKIVTLKKLMRHLRKAKRTDNPDFKIQYNSLKNPDQDYHRISRIILNEEDSSTNIYIDILEGGLVKVEFVYHPRSSQKEMSRIDKAISILQDRRYKIQ